MTWFRIDDGFWSHPKTSTLSDSSVALWVRAGAYSCQHLTDGFIPKDSLKLLGKPASAKGLVAAGLWLEVAGGWRFHDWDEYQETSSAVKKRREDARERQRKSRKKSRVTRPGDGREIAQEFPERGNSENDSQEEFRREVTQGFPENDPRLGPFVTDENASASNNGDVSQGLSRVTSRSPAGARDRGRARNPTRPDLIENSPTDDDSRNVATRESSSSFSDGTPIPDEPPPTEISASTPPPQSPTSAARTVVRQELGTAGYPRKTLDRLAVQVGRLAHQGLADPVIREALREWERRSGAKPEWLESIAGDVVQRHRATTAGVTTTPTRPSKLRGIAELAAAARAQEDNHQQQEIAQ